MVVVERAAPHDEITTFDADEGDGDERQKATVDMVTKVLNEPGSFTFRLPLFDSATGGPHPATALVVPLMCEVQVYRGADTNPIAWGVPLQPSLEGGAWVFNCPGLLWYFTRRVFGPISTNYLANPNFETNLTGWTKVGFSPTLFTAVRSTALRLRGPGTVRMEVPPTVDLNDETDNYLLHTFNVDTGGVGLVLFLAGWYWIDPTVTLTAPAAEERGLYIDSPNCLPDSQPSWAPITMNSPVGVPQRLETELHLPPGLTGETVTVRLYCPVGAIHLGALSVTALESVSSEPEGTDVTEMMRRIVAYCHDAYDYDFDTDTDAAGVTEITAYQFADLGNCFAALQTYPARGLADFDMVLTPTTRTFTTYAPRKGSHKAGNTLTIPATAVNLTGYRLDGEATSTRVIRRGAGDGSDREIGFAEDTSFLDGLPLDSVEDAPPETPVDGLDGLAATDLARLADIVELPEFDVPAEGWWGVVDTGDTVDVEIDWGPIQVDTVRRVVSMRLDPKRDRVAVGTNVP